MKGKEGRERERKVDKERGEMEGREREVDILGLNGEKKGTGWN